MLPGRAALRDGIVEEQEADGWERVKQPDWMNLPDPSGMQIREYTIAHGDTFVYKAVSDSIEFVVFRKPKSDYHTTTADEGTCPNCQAYVRRLDGDRFLTCHRCGWTVGKPVLRWFRYPSWIDYYFSSDR
jgi:hypothetical protein